jgi:hypothetical protein
MGATAGDGAPVTGGSVPGRHERPAAARLGAGVPPDGMPDYKGGPLDAERGPGLGCFWIQVVALLVLLVLTPLAVASNWPDWVNAALLIATLGLLLFVGQTLIFLLRLVAAESRGRRRPLASATRTVGEIEDAGASGAPGGDTGSTVASGDTAVDERAPGSPGPTS